MIKEFFKKGMVQILLFLIIVNSYSVVSYAASKPATPAAVRVWRHSDSKLRLKWGKVKNSDGYIIYKYDISKKRYKKYKTVKDKNTVIFIDEVGNHTSAKYKVSAFKKSGKKNIVSKKSNYVRARTYKQGDRKVNAGQVKIRVTGESYYENNSEDLAYYETRKLTEKVKPSKYSKAKGKNVISTKVRWYSSNPKIATVDQNGRVKARAKAGKCYIYSRAHNGRISNKIKIFVENYAKPKKSTLNLGEAWDDSERYGAVLEMFENNYRVVTDIAEYFYINRPAGNETFKCWMEAGEVKMVPENYVAGKMKQTIYNFIKNFPFDIRLDVNSNIVKFTQLYGLSEDHRYAGAKVVFKYDQNKIDSSSYTTEYKIAENWSYGSFAGI